MTKTKRDYKWAEVHRLEKGGHRIFREDRGEYAAPETCRWAIADNSGSRPETTDDGVLWLDFARPLDVSLDRGSWVVSIPVTSARRADITDLRCGGGVDTFSALVERFPAWGVRMSASAKKFVKACVSCGIYED